MTSAGDIAACNNNETGVATGAILQRTSRQILLVGENEQESIAELILVEHPLELLAGLRDTFPIVGVDDEDDTLRVLEVCVAGDRVRYGAGGDTSDAGRRRDMTRTMPPERTDLVLSSNIPDGERDVLVLHRLDVET